MNVAFIYQVYFGALLACCSICLYRISTGPTVPDRTVAIDVMGTVMVGFCAILSIITGRDYYMNIAIVWALLSFIGTLALAKFLEGRGFDE